MGQSLLEYCREKGQQELLEQWLMEKNSPDTPERITYGSKKKVWWHCNKGHEWQAQVKSRCAGAGCPFCANRKIIPGVNDMRTTHPSLAAQWHPTKNAPLKPKDVPAGTARKVWWQCKKGHEWQAKVNSRAAGAGCPVCTNRTIIPGENDLASKYPNLVEQWLQSRNGELCPEQVSEFSNRRVWWQCKLGHQWESIIAHRVAKGTDCPYCTGRKVLAGFNDLQTRMPQIARDWHPTLNGDLTPEQVTVGSRKRVWWECPYGHVWQTVVFSRTGKQQSACPVCAGKVKDSKQ